VSKLAPLLSRAREQAVFSDFRHRLLANEESKVQINCLGCGYKVDLPAEGYDDYEGQIKCFACGALMESATEEGAVKAVRSVHEVSLPVVVEVFERSGG